MERILQDAGGIRAKIQAKMAGNREEGQQRRAGAVGNEGNIMIEHGGIEHGGIELVVLTDPNEGAFTVGLPKGWRNEAYSVRPHGVHRSVVRSQSPDGAVFLFLGDPDLPAFAEPTPQMYPGHPFANITPMMQVHPYVPAEPFFQDYLRQRYGRAPGFRITGGAPCLALEQQARASAQRQGLNPYITTISLSFECAADTTGRPMRGRLHGLTLSLGPTWVADVGGVLTTTTTTTTTTTELDPADFDELFFRIEATRKTDPQWQARQQMQMQMQHAQTMGQIDSFTAQLQMNHQNNMAAIQASAQQHQVRMDALHAAGDASLQSWYDQQAQSDAIHRSTVGGITEQYSSSGGSGSTDFSHQRFLNTVTEQETVVDQSGNTYQVEAGHERYYRHKRDGTFVGADRFTEREDLRGQRGVDPDDYEELNIRQR